MLRITLFQSDIEVSDQVIADIRRTQRRQRDQHNNLPCIYAHGNLLLSPATREDIIRQVKEWHKEVQELARLRMLVKAERHSRWVS